MNEIPYKEIDPEGFATLKVISEANHFNRWMFDEIAPFCRGKILEIGSGIGNISRFFYESRQDIVVSDIRNGYCDYLLKEFKLSERDLIRNLDLVDARFAEKYKSWESHFDTIFALNVVEHIENDNQAIANCYRLLKPGGTLIILVPAFPLLYNNFDKELGHYKRYVKSSLGHLFTSNGFRIRKAKYFNCAGIPGWFVSGKIQRNQTIPENQMKLYNTLVPFFKILDRAAFGSFGLSVIVVGEKG